MSEKEQAQLLKLLRKWLQFEAEADAVKSAEEALAMLPRREALMKETADFLLLELPQRPESHGHRRG